MNFLLLNQWALWFLPALAIPIIIHLLFKRQYKIIDWAAIQFLIEAEKRIRHKLRLVEYILLMLRVLVVVALILLFSRLLLKNDITLIPGQNHGNDHIFLVDNSPSLNLKINGLAHFNQVKKNMVAFVEQLAMEHGDHRVTIVSWVDGKALIREVNIKDDLEGVKKNIESMNVLDAPVNYLRGMDIVDKYTFKNTNSYKVIYYVSDFQNSFMQDSNADAVLTAFENQAKAYNEAHYFLLPAPAQTKNLSIESVDVRSNLIAQNVPAHFSVKVRNNGSGVQSKIEVSLVGENQLPIIEVIDQLGANEEVEIPFLYTFKEVGLHRLRFTLPEDDNERDNVFYQSLNVKAGSKVLIVVSETSLRENESEGYFISNALNPPGKQYGGNICEIKSDTEFADLFLNDYDVIYLCNIFQINARMQEQLDAWVQDGGELVLALGNQIDVNLYNEHIFKVLGIGARIEDIVYTGEKQYAKILVKNALNSCLSFFKSDNSVFLDGVQFYQWYKVSLDDHEKSQIVASYQFEGNNPCIVQFERGEGGITLFTSTLDNKWNNWPSEFSYVIVNLELVRQGLKNPFEGLSIVAGGSANMKISSQHYEGKATIALHDGDEKNDLIAETENNNRHNFISNDMYLSGFFDLSLKAYDSSETIFGGDINLHPLEGRMDQFQIEKSKLKDNSKVKFHELQWLKDGGGLDKKNEIWKTILVILFVLMCVESLFAWFFGRAR